MQKDATRDPMWPVLVEAVHAILMYPRHKAYVRDVMLREKPSLGAEEVRDRLGIPLGEAMVILFELRHEAKNSRLT